MRLLNAEDDVGGRAVLLCFAPTLREMAVVERTRGVRRNSLVPARISQMSHCKWRSVSAGGAATDEQAISRREVLHWSASPRRQHEWRQTRWKTAS